MCYSIFKKQFNWEVSNLNYNNISGYKVTPKNKIYNAIEVNKMTIVKSELIKKLLKKKVRLMLETLDVESDEGNDRKALSHIERYRKLINEKYSKFLDDKYISLLNQKINILEREFKSNLNLERKREEAREILLQHQYEIQDEIEEKENRRRR